MTIKTFVHNHRRLATITMAAAVTIGTFSLNAAPAGASGVTVGRAGIQAVYCHPNTHQASFNFQVFADINLHLRGTEQFAIYAQTRYRPYGSSSWSAWGSGSTRYYTITDYSVITLTGPPKAPGDYQVRFAYYWQHFTSSGQAYWTWTDSWDYPQQYHQFDARWDYEGLYSAVCSL